MTGTLDLSRWRSAPRGLGYRRWTIIAAGLRQLLAFRLFKILLAAAWSSGVAIALLGFAFSQSIADGGWLQTLATQIGPRLQAVVSMLAAFVLLYPDICIGGFYTLVFWLHSFVGLWLSMVALTALIPRLVTADRATHALIVYLARPLTSVDYLLGKLGIIAAVLALTWTGPLLLGWLLSVAFAPNLDFVTYSFEPLLRALGFNVVALVALAAIALGVSAVARTPRATILAWLGLWLVLGFITLGPQNPGPLWLKRASLTRNLSEIRAGILRPDAAFITAGEELPLTDRQFAANLKRAGTRTEAQDFTGALASLGGLAVAASLVFLRKLRPE